MSTSTTNYGFTKMDPGESADVNIWNTNLDLMDSTVKQVQDTGGSTWHWERWAYESSYSVPANSTSSWLYLVGPSWTLYESEGNNSTPVIFDAGGSHGEWVLNREGIYKICLRVRLNTSAAVSAGASKGGVILGILRPGNLIREAHSEVMEIHQGNQELMAEWLVDVRSVDGDLAPNLEYSFGITQENSTNTTVSGIGIFNTFNTFATFEQVSD